jgi:3-dehydroquinate synthase
VDLGLLDSPSADRIVKLITRAGLPIGNTKLNADEIVNAMAFDKKVTASKIRFILPDRIGHVLIRDDVPMAAVNRATQRIVA